MIDIGNIDWVEYLQANSYKIPFLNEQEIFVHPNISAKSALIFDIHSNKVIYSKDENKKLPIASLTKLMTTLIISEENLDFEIFKVSKNSSEIVGSTMNLQENDLISVKDLLHGLLINSGNDAAYTLAEGNAGSVKKFVKKMNQKAKELGMNNTHFSNPAGLDYKENYSSSNDLLILSKELLKHKNILEISSKEEFIAQNFQKNKNYKLKNTNSELNNFLKIKGLKTGKTPNAKECFIGVTQTKKPQISIVLGSNNRFLDTKTLLYIYNK